MSVLRTKSIEQSLADTDEPEYRLKKSLTALDLTVFGIGVVIGAGIFTLTGRAAGTMAGPSIVLSFVLSAICCVLAALCYAEFASTVPVSGSAYTFSYASLGEIVAWIIGWDLMLELLLGASVVAQGWAEYVETLVHLLGGNGFSVTVGPFHWLASLLVAALCVLITIGIKESLRVNMVLVFVKIFIVLFVIIAGLFFVKASNYVPFIPPAQAGANVHGLSQPLFQAMLGLQPTAFGVFGIFSGAALVFFAYIGFDVVATTAEEAKNPQRDLPIGIIASLLICTVLYCAVCLVITGMVKYDKIDPSAALAKAFESVGKGWIAVLISAGAVAGLTTVVLTLLTGASRVLFAMCRDNLLPRQLATLHPRFKTPWVVTGLIGVIAVLIAGVRSRVVAVADGEHRHADRVHPGVDRGHRAPPQAPRAEAGLPGARRPVRPDPGSGDLPVPGAQLVDRDVDPVRCLDGRRVRHLLPLRLPQVQGTRGGAGRPRHRRSAESQLVPQYRARSFGGGHVRHTGGKEALAVHPFGHTRPVQVRGDPAQMERPAGAQDHTQVDVHRGCHDAFIEHQPDLLRQAGQRPVAHLV